MVKSLFVECKACGERWKVATIPMDAGLLGKALKRAACPNCAGDPKQLFMCPTEGEGAVTEARNGKVNEHAI